MVSTCSPGSTPGRSAAVARSTTAAASRQCVARDSPGTERDEGFHQTAASAATTRTSRSGHGATGSRLTTTTSGSRR